MKKIRQSTRGGFVVKKHAFCFLLVLALLVSSCGSQPPADAPKTEPARPAATPVKLDLVALPPVPVPADNPLTAEKVALGKQLFFDKRLSKNGDMSCETCHL